MREFYKEELIRLKKEYLAVPNKETRRKLDIANLMKNFEELIKYTNERED